MPKVYDDPAKATKACSETLFTQGQFFMGGPAKTQDNLW